MVPAGNAPRLLSTKDPISWDALIDGPGLGVGATVLFVLFSFLDGI